MRFILKKNLINIDAAGKAAIRYFKGKFSTINTLTFVEDGERIDINGFYDLIKKAKKVMTVTL